jgi:hypothetical protein
VSHPDPKPKLTAEQLIDLFKHWDGHVHGKDNLFVPLSLASFPAAAVSWNDLSPAALAVLGTASVVFYVYYLLVLRRSSEFQDAIFHEFRTRADLPSMQHLLVSPRGRVGVRKLRILLLPLFAVLWCLMVGAKLLDGGPAGSHARSEPQDLAALACTLAVAMVALGVTLWAWRDLGASASAGGTEAPPAGAPNDGAAAGSAG